MTTKFFSSLSFIAVFGSGIRDPGWVKIRIRDKHPRSATLLLRRTLGFTQTTKNCIFKRVPYGTRGKHALIFQSKIILLIKNVAKNLRNRLTRQKIRFILWCSKCFC
jgi:hypothetical protein